VRDSGTVTASLGVSSSDGNAPLSLVAAADAALYRAKAGGRDRVEAVAMETAHTPRILPP
jgi:PleD family two-component response regulator